MAENEDKKIAVSGSECSDSLCTVRIKRFNAEAHFLEPYKSIETFRNDNEEVYKIYKNDFLLGLLVKTYESGILIGSAFFVSHRVREVNI